MSSSVPTTPRGCWAATALIALVMVAVALAPVGTLLLVLQLAFALLHGAHRYGWRAIGLYIVASLVISNILENLSIATGFPFGHYHYTGGGKIFEVPWIIGANYLATVLLGEVHRTSSWLTTIGTPRHRGLRRDRLGPGTRPRRRHHQPVLDLGKRRRLLRCAPGQFPGLDLHRLPVHAGLRPLPATARLTPHDRFGPGHASDLQAVLLYAATTIRYYVALPASGRP
jgi:Carotenoid biosynthesis protein